MYLSLVGKKISADGWQRDNGGSLCGIITEIEVDERYNQCKVFVEKTNQFSMNSMTFSIRQMNLLLLDGKLPEANKFLNSGTNAEIFN